MAGESTFTYEHRRFSRVPVEMPVTLISEAGETITAETRDMSALGVCLTGSLPLSPDITCTICCAIEEGKHIEVKGTVIHADTARTGIEITAIKADTVAHLRELLAAHAEHPDEIDIEMISRPGFPPDLY